MRASQGFQDKRMVQLRGLNMGWEFHLTTTARVLEVVVMVLDEGSLHKTARVHLRETLLADVLLESRQITVEAISCVVFTKASFRSLFAACEVVYQKLCNNFVLGQQLHWSSHKLEL